MKNKPEFQLAIGIFIGISIIGTVFGLWWASYYAGMKPRTNVDAATEAAPAPPENNSPQTAPAENR